MASEYIDTQVRAIRESLYGLNARKPTADAIEYIAKNNDFSLVGSVEAVLDTSHVDWVEVIEHVIPVPATDFEASATNTAGLATSVIGGDDYLLTDTSGDSVSQISGTTEDYLLNLSDSRWTTTGLNPSSYIEYEYINHYETYILTLDLART